MTSATRLRQRKRSPQEIRELLMTAGEELALDPSTRGGLAGLTLSAVFEKIQREQGILLTNASVLGRVFDATEAFRREVLIKIASSESQDFTTSSDYVFRNVIVKADLTTPERRWDALRETCRVSANIMLDTLAASQTWRVWLGILAYAIAEPEVNADLVEALKISYHRLNQQSIETYSAALQILGFRPREPRDLEYFSFSADTLAEGVGIRMLVEPDSFKGIMLPTGIGGKRQRWTKFSLGFWALASQIVELDPDWVAPSASA